MVSSIARPDHPPQSSSRARSCDRHRKSRDHVQAVHQVGHLVNERTLSSRFMSLDGITSVGKHNHKSMVSNVQLKLLIVRIFCYAEGATWLIMQYTDDKADHHAFV